MTDSVNCFALKEVKSLNLSILSHTKKTLFTEKRVLVFDTIVFPLIYQAHCLLDLAPLHLCRLPGVIGPVPRPLSIRAFLSLIYSVYAITDTFFCQVYFDIFSLCCSKKVPLEGRLSLIRWRVFLLLCRGASRRVRCRRGRYALRDCG